MSYLADLQKRLSDGITEDDVKSARDFLKAHEHRKETFPCGCHGERTATEVIAALDAREEHWEEYVVSVLCGIAVSKEIQSSYESTQSMVERFELLLDLTRDYVTAVVKETTSPLMEEQLGAHFAIESALFREKLRRMELELEMHRRTSLPTAKVDTTVH